MNRLIFFLVILSFGLFSCTDPTSKNNKQVNNVPDTVGYFAARNLKGLATFKIGETTYKEALKNIKDEIRKDSKKGKETNYEKMPHYTSYYAYYDDFRYDKNGNISGTYQREYFDMIIKEVESDTIEKYLKDDFLKKGNFGLPTFKSIEMNEYYIEDLELRSFELKFYKDTLYEIKCVQNEKLESGFKVKYGEGKKSVNNEYKTPLGTRSEWPESESMKKNSQVLKIDEVYIWENEKVKAISQTYIQYYYKGSSTHFSDASSNCFFKIETKNEKLKTEISECEKVARKVKERLIEQKKQNEFNKL